MPELEDIGAEAVSAEVLAKGQANEAVHDPKQAQAALRGTDGVAEEQADEAEEQANEAEEQAILASTTLPRPLVFLSYRHNPDEPLAAALKRLLESTLDPSPHIFVAGDGGLRPSEIGFKPQLQAAVQQARAFLGLISPAAADREWLYYEAGAAWGRGQLYAPILAGTTPSDLSSVIADYQATRASDRNEMRRLVEQIAAAVNAVVRKSFARSFVAFERALNQHLSPPSRPQGGGDLESTDTPLWAAAKLRMAGKSKEADELYRELEDKAEGLEDKTNVRISYIISGKETGFELLDKLEEINPSYKTTACYSLWVGILEDDTEIAIRHLRTASSHPDASTATHRIALVELARKTHRSGFPTDALVAMLSHLRSKDRQFRLMTSELWMELRKADPPIVRLLVASYGNHSNRSNSLLKEIVDISREQGWLVLAVYYAELHDMVARTGSSANDVGRAYSSAKLHSLAFRAFNRSADAGVGVAKCNMASVLLTEVVPAAGLAIVQQHSGAFDSMSPDYPHRVRAELEARVNDEKLRATKMSAIGEQIARLLRDAAAQGFSCSSPDGPASSVVLSDGQKSFVVANLSNGFALHDGDGKPILFFRRLMVELPFWSLMISDEIRGICTSTPEGDLVVIAFSSLDSEAAEVTVTRYRRVMCLLEAPQLPPALS